jgi:hypothetical protein
MLKFLKWSAIILIGTPVLLYLIWLSGNLYREDISPELSLFLTRQPDHPLPEKDNAYFDVIGLSAPSDMEPHSWGVTWFTQASTNDLLILENKPANPIQLVNYPVTSKLSDLPCSKTNSQFACIEEVANNLTATQSTLDNDSLLLMRFDNLLDKEYQEPFRQMSPKSDFPPFAALGRAAKLGQIRIALEIAKHHDDAALQRWGRETGFLLRQTRNSHSLIDTLICTSLLTRYQKLLANYITVYPKRARSNAKQLLSILEPFSKSSLTLRHAMENEAVFSSRFLLSQAPSLGNEIDGEQDFLGDVVNLLAYPLYDKSETANEYAAFFLEYARIATLDGDAYREELAKISSTQKRTIDETFSFHYHNPTGKLIISMAGATDLSRYFYRVDDVIANKNLLIFAVNLLSADTLQTKQIAQSLRVQNNSLIHPFIGRMPEWDEKSRTLSYAVPDEYKKNNPPMKIQL